MDDNEAAALIRQLRGTRERARRLRVIAAQVRDAAEELREHADVLCRSAPEHAQKVTVPDQETATPSEGAVPVTTSRRRPGGLE